MQFLAHDHPASRITRLIERMGRLSRSREAASMLHPAQWEALRYLARANRFSRRPSDVASWLASGKGTTSQTLMSLERKGLVRRRPDERDRRSYRLDLTEEGLGLVACDPLADVSRSIARLPPLHAAALSQSLAHILGDLVEHRPAGVFENCRACSHFDPTGMFCRRFEAKLEAEEPSSVCAFSQPMA